MNIQIHCVPDYLIRAGKWPSVDSGGCHHQSALTPWWEIKGRQITGVAISVMFNLWAFCWRKGRKKCWMHGHWFYQPRHFFCSKVCNPKHRCLKVPLKCLQFIFASWEGTDMGLPGFIPWWSRGDVVLFIQSSVSDVNFWYSACC